MCVKYTKRLPNRLVDKEDEVELREELDEGFAEAPVVVGDIVAEVEIMETHGSLIVEIDTLIVNLIADITTTLPHMGPNHSTKEIDTQIIDQVDIINLT